MQRVSARGVPLDKFDGIAVNVGQEALKAMAAAGLRPPEGEEEAPEIYLLKVVSSSALGGGPLGSRQLIATSLSDFTVHVLERRGGELHPVCRFRAHDAPVTDLLFFPGPSPTLMTASEDGLAKTWDLSRSLASGSDAQCVNQVACDGRRSPVWSISASKSGELLAAATQQGVLIWRKVVDKRHGLKWKKHVALEESFCDVVTQVLFHPDESSSGIGAGPPIVLAACGEDGLVCLFDLNKGPDEDENLLAVLNADSSIAQVGFFGQRQGGFLWCRTNDETFRAWNWTKACVSQEEVGRDVTMGESEEESEVSSMRDARKNLTESLSRSAPSAKIDYLVDCHWDTSSAELRLCGGNTSGQLFLFQLAVEAFDHGKGEAMVRFSSPKDIKPLRSLCGGGHRSVVRSMDSSHAPDWYLTCGEDGILCQWTPSRKGYGGSSGVAPPNRAMSRYRPY
ncbi:WD40 repeat domain-containing protein [Chloropicon primus]|uniref:WD40 repeat domain-containing protein n=1 Tax=Chloropicon primus TaxID=1764295 RepID=A0A5B8MQ99_9CHLO|nr:WD40 repeat domain-containing protein [Chloropicon primus]UPR01880.1 WD40 repeat domain-containing protein [Chloropicon primus]|eukprot:QDZ22656.1 WD40 repeat domain-containing protein [Chloropicon primus]